MSISNRRQSRIHIAVIYNLSFPHEHPRGWGSFTYGWLPPLRASIIGQTFADSLLVTIDFRVLLGGNLMAAQTTVFFGSRFPSEDVQCMVYHRSIFGARGGLLLVYVTLKLIVLQYEGPLELT